MWAKSCARCFGRGDVVVMDNLLPQKESSDPAIDHRSRCGSSLPAGVFAGPQSDREDVEQR